MTSESDRGRREDARGPGSTEPPRRGPVRSRRAPTGPALAAVSVLLLAGFAAACGERVDGEDAPLLRDAGRAAEASVPEAAAGPEAATGDSALRAMARSLVPAVESLASLTFRRPPRLARSSRAALEDFLVARLSEEWPAERARAVRDAYARLGLMPDTLDLRRLLRELYLEQVVGYYDPAADTLFVRAGVGPGRVRPVLVHELVHALQDQYVDLDSLTEALARRNDRSAAARAALEGHATYAMVEWQLSRRMGRPVDLTRLPDLSAVLGGADLTSLAGMPALTGAPRIVRETLIFPYVGGLGLMQALWRARGDRPPPLGRWMPSSTEQVLHPERLLAEPPDAPTEVRFGDLPTGWREVHTGGLGELEIRIWLASHLADSARAREAATGWDGDRYRLLRDRDGREALAWATIWDSPARADSFRRAASGAFARLDGRTAGRDSRVRRRRVRGRPAVTVWDGPAGLRPAVADSALRFSTGSDP